MEAQPATDIVALPKINTLNIDMLVMILQVLIEEEADAHLGYYWWQTGEPIEPMMLALVCKKWRDIVYSTPSFWPIIKVSMCSSVDKMQKRLDRLADRARNAPVDLYILDVHSDDIPGAHLWIYHNTNCCCQSGKIRLDFTKLSNVRRLRVDFKCGNFSILVCFPL